MEKQPHKYDFEFIASSGDFSLDEEELAFWEALCEKADLQFRTQASKAWHKKDGGELASTCEDALMVLGMRKKRLLEGSDDVGAMTDDMLDDFEVAGSYIYESTILNALATQTIVRYTSCGTSVISCWDVDDEEDRAYVQDQLGRTKVPVFSESQRDAFLCRRTLPEDVLAALRDPLCSLRSNRLFRVQEADKRNAVVEAVRDLLRLYAMRSLDLGDLQLGERFALAEKAAESLRDTSEMTDVDLRNAESVKCVEAALYKDAALLGALIRLKTYPAWEKR